MPRNRNPQIYIKGYSRNASVKDLKKWFKPYGKITQIQYKGSYCFIVQLSDTQEYQDYYDAEYAINHMNNQKVQGCRLTVEPSGQKKYKHFQVQYDRSRSRSQNKRRKQKCKQRQCSSSSGFSSSDSIQKGYLQEKRMRRKIKDLKRT